MTQATATKRCPRCGEVQPLTGFSIDRSKSSGRSSHCKACDNATRREAYYRKLGRLTPPVRPTPAIRRCEACAGEITGQGKRFCSLVCANGSPRPPRFCPICASPVHRSSKVWCSRQCRTYGEMKTTTCDLPLASCPSCRKTFTVRRGSRSCGDLRCYHRLTYARLAAKPCETCGADVPSRQGAPRWCDAACFRRSPEYKAQTQRGHRRRRARKRNAVSEAYLARDIFERDGWHCHICGGAIDRNARVPDSLAATIDHLIPLARGGADVRTNVKAAHFICNSRKGDRGGGEQLLLVG